MNTGSFMLLLDTWTTLLQQMTTEGYSRILMGPHGGRVVRIRELVQAGLVSSRHGMLGGHKLARPLSAIHLSSLLALRDIPDGPTQQFLSRYAAVPLTEILSWVPARNLTWVASLETLTGVFSAMSHVTPVIHNTLRVQGISDGYVLQVLCRASRLGLITAGSPQVSGGRSGSILVKPYETFTIADVRPLLSSRRTVYNVLLEKGASLKLCDLHSSGGSV